MCTLCQVLNIEKAKNILMSEIEILEHILKVRAKKDFLDHVTKMHNAYKICAASLPFEDRVK